MTAACMIEDSLEDFFTFAFIVLDEHLVRGKEHGLGLRWCLIFGRGGLVFISLVFEELFGWNFVQRSV